MASGGGSDGKPAMDAPEGRVWQACLSCRRKKVKCDGRNPCHNCTSRDRTCEFPGSRDNASVSRYYSTSFEARCQHMESLCQRLEVLAGQLSQSIEALARVPRDDSAATGSPNEDLIQAAHVLRSMPDLRGSVVSGFQRHQGQPTHSVDRVQSGADGPSMLEDYDDDSQTVTSSQSSEPCVSLEAQVVDPAGALVRDSYGRLRFVGGATSNMLIEAAKSLLPPTPTATSSCAADARESRRAEGAEDVEIPLFVPGRVWPELPFLPKPEDVSRPPQYVADLLIGLYFDKLHCTFPIVYRPHFMHRYHAMLRAGADRTSSQYRRFLLVLFAVCACASSLLPATSEGGLPGIEYYQKALVLYYASTGEASLERVQCVALLAMCSAGWNTLSQSWALAGKAVRDSLDMGLHMSSRLMSSPKPASSDASPSDVLRQQVSRRIWWCVYILDRVTSICLGRPMAVQDEDCDCALPLDMPDDQLESSGHDGQTTTTATTHQAAPDHRSLPRSTGSIAGFLAFARLCQIAGKIQRLTSPLHLRQLNASSKSPRRAQRFLERVDAHDQALRRWLETLPDDVQFSANSMDRDGPGGGPALIMCVISYIVHAGSLLNLYRCFVSHPKRSCLGTNDAVFQNSISQCMKAAQNCINAAEVVRDLVPSSHYLAICVHYLTLSGIVLLRMPVQGSGQQSTQAVQKCIGVLRDLEIRWSGAKRSRAIIEQLLLRHNEQVVRDANPDGDVLLADDVPAPGGGLRDNKRTLADLEETTESSTADDEAFLWREIPGSELFAFEPLDSVMFAPWGED